MFVSRMTRFVIDKLYWTSPYRWVDEWQKHLEQKAKQSTQDWERIRRRRYLLSEIYIVGWLGLAILLLILSRYLPAVLAYILLLRVVGILNKELGVVLFGICKITEDRGVSSPGRVITLALVNYLTAGLLFSFLYSKLGTYQIDGTTVSALPLQDAIIQGLSIQFTLQPVYRPMELGIWISIIGQAMFCFVFGAIILSLFVSLVQLTSTLED